MNAVHDASFLPAERRAAVAHVGSGYALPAYVPMASSGCYSVGYPFPHPSAMPAMYPSYQAVPFGMMLGYSSPVGYCQPSEMTITLTVPTGPYLATSTIAVRINPDDGRHEVIIRPRTPEEGYASYAPDYTSDGESGPGLNCGESTCGSAVPSESTGSSVAPVKYLLDPSAEPYAPAIAAPACSGSCGARETIIVTPPVVATGAPSVAFRDAELSAAKKTVSHRVDNTRHLATMPDRAPRTGPARSARCAAAAVAGTEEQEWTLVKRGAKVVAPCDKDRVIVVGGVPAGLHVANVSADSVVSLATEVTRTVSPEPCYGGSRKKNTRRAHEARGGAGGADDICVVDECARASAVIVPDAVVPQAATHPTACGGGAVASALKACVAAAAASGDSADYDCERYSSDSAARWVAIIMQAFRDSKRVLTDRAVTTLIEIFKKAAVDDGAVSITKVMSDLKSTAASLTKKCAEYRASSQQKKFLNVFTASMYGPTGDCRMLMSHAEELFQTPASAMCTLEFSAKWVAINRQCEGAAASIVVKHAMVLTELRKQLEAVAEKDPLRAEFKQVIEAAQTYTQAINEGYTVISALCKRLSLMGNLITLLLKTEQYGSAVNGALHCSLFAICNSESKSKELLCYGQDYLVITALKKNQLTNFFMKLILQYKSSLFAGIHGKRDVNNYLSDLSAKLDDAEVIRTTLLDYLGARWRTLSVREDITDNVIEGFLTQWITESFAPLADEKLSPMRDPLIRLMTLRITINNFLATVETINAQEKVVLLRMEYCLKKREGELIKRLILSLTGKDSDSEVIDQLGRILNLEAHSHEGRYKTQFTAYVNSLLATTTTGSAEVLKDCVMRFVMSYNKHALPALSDADHDSFLTGYYQLNCISELNRNIAALGSLASSGVCDCSLVTFFLMLFQEKGIEGASESFVHELYFLFEQHVQRYYGTLPLPIGQRKALYDFVQLEEHAAPLLEGIVSREPLSVGQKFFQQLILILDNIFRASPRGDAFFATKPADYADMKRLLLESLRDDAAVLAPAAGGAGGAAAAAGLA